MDASVLDRPTPPAAAEAVSTVAGTPFEGGFFAGTFRIGADTFALIVAPKAAGEFEGHAWGLYGEEIAGADSFFDGLANTQAMAAAGSQLAQRIAALDIGGFTDWYLPSRDELELMYRNLKPTAAANYRRSGDNPSSIPVGYAYGRNSPSQTQAEAFRADGAEAMAEEWYWSSTQFSARNAWNQDFSNGGQDFNGKDVEGRARAVRRFKLTA